MICNSILGCQLIYHKGFDLQTIFQKISAGFLWPLIFGLNSWLPSVNVDCNTNTQYVRYYSHTLTPDI